MLKIFAGMIAMLSSLAHAAEVPSLHNGFVVSLSGFECGDESVHMVEWLGKGRDFRKFVIHDAEGELYSQDKGAQLLSAHCRANPKYETRALPKNDGTSIAVVKSVSVTFPLELRVRSSDGKVWRLDVNQNYVASELNRPGRRKLTLNFGIVGSNAE